MSSELDDLWADVHTDAYMIDKFLDFLSSKGIILCETTKDSYVPTRHAQMDLIYQYFLIDPVKLEKERKALHDRLRGEKA